MVADEFCRQLLSVFKLSSLNAHVLAQTHIFRCTEPKEKIIMPVRSSGTHHPLNKHQDKNERNCVFNPFHSRERINFLRKCSHNFSGGKKCGFGAVFAD